MRIGGRRVVFRRRGDYHCWHFDQRDAFAATTEMTLSDEEIAEIRGQLYELQVEHRDLDLVIEHLTANPPPDQLLIRRLKKRKLQLKDRITLLERLLVPDIPA